MTATTDLSANTTEHLIADIERLDAGASSGRQDSALNDVCWLAKQIAPPAV